MNRALSIGKHGIRHAIERAGYDVRRKGANVGALDALATLAAHFGCSLVVDVGANEGEFGHGMRWRGYRGRILSFEPRQGAFERLQARCATDPAWEARNVALGRDAREISINVSQNGVSSSILPMSALHAATAPDSEYIRSERVSQVRLDDVEMQLAPGADRLALKLDVQGYEEQVLAGAENVIRRAAAIQIELSLGAVYEGQADWKQITTDLVGAGFTPWAIEPVLGDRTTGQTLQVDLVLARL